MGGSYSHEHSHARPSLDPSSPQPCGGGRWLGTMTKGGGEGTFLRESGIGEAGRAGVRRGAVSASTSPSTGQTCVRAGPPPHAGAGDSCSPVQRPWSPQEVQEYRAQAGMTAVGVAAVGWTLAEGLGRKRDILRPLGIGAQLWIWNCVWRPRGEAGGYGGEGSWWACPNSQGADDAHGFIFTFTMHLLSWFCSYRWQRSKLTAPPCL